MELTRAELIFGATMLHAETIVGFEGLFPEDAAERHQLWESGRAQLLAAGTLQLQPDETYQLDPLWIYHIALAVDPNVALVTQRIGERGVQTVGTYFGDDVALEMTQIEAERVRMTALASTALALTRLANVLSMTTMTVQVIPYHQSQDGLTAQPAWQPNGSVTSDMLEALLK